MTAYKTYTLGNNSVINWRQSIDTYYKRGLEQFSDPRTIQIMLDMAEDFLSKDAGMIAAVLGSSGQQQADEFAAVFEEERVVMQEIHGELTAWIADRDAKKVSRIT
ncbi:hypothetical protein [Agrobacterium sp. CG674]